MRGNRVVDAKLSRSARCVPSERISRMNRILTREATSGGGRRAKKRKALERKGNIEIKETRSSLRR